MASPLRYSLLAYADLGSARIERLFVRETREEAVRFRRMGREAVKALELPEDELLILIGDAAAAGVFSPGFLDELRAILDAHKATRYGQGEGNTPMKKNTLSNSMLNEKIGKGGSSALDEGRKAYWRNEPVEKCPYSDSVLRQAWMEGWRAAHTEFEKS